VAHERHELLLCDRAVLVERRDDRRQDYPKLAHALQYLTTRAL
jgi:hypothetical protein